MNTKEFSARVKAAGTSDGLAEGQFSALVSVFGNVDTYGDIVMPGAFTATLAAWAAKGDPIPVIWSHDWRDPFAHMGTVLEAVETEAGLEVLGEFTDLADNPKAAQVYRLMKGRRVTQFSFAYDVDDYAITEDDDGRMVYELRALSLHEVGPCLIGVNQETELLAVKAHDLTRSAKAGRVLSKKNLDALVAAHDEIGAVITAAQDSGEESKTRREHGDDVDTSAATKVAPATLVAAVGLAGL